MKITSQRELFKNFLKTIPYQMYFVVMFITVSLILVSFHDISPQEYKSKVNECVSKEDLFSSNHIVKSETTKLKANAYSRIAAQHGQRRDFYLDLRIYQECVSSGRELPPDLPLTIGILGTIYYKSREGRYYRVK